MNNLTTYPGPHYAGAHENLAVEAVLRRIETAVRVLLEGGSTAWPMLKAANPEGGPALLVPLDTERIRKGFLDPSVNREEDQQDIPCILVRLTDGNDRTEEDTESGPSYDLKLDIVIAVYMEEAEDYQQATDLVAILRRSFLQQRFLDGGHFRIKPPFAWRSSENPAESWPHYFIAAEITLEAPSITEEYDEHGQTYNDNKW